MIGRLVNWSIGQLITDQPIDQVANRPDSRHYTKYFYDGRSRVGPDALDIVNRIEKLEALVLT